MTLPRPNASLLLEGGGAVGLDGGALSAAQAAVARVVVDLSVDEAHDRVELMVWRDSALAAAEPGATLTVGLGDGDDLADVLTVEVAGSDATGWGGVVTGYAASRRLSTTYVGRSYVDQSVADIVSDLLGEAALDEGDVEAPLTLPLLHVDPHRSVWATLHGLARRTGSQIISGSDGTISFIPVPGSSGGGGLAGALASGAAAVGLASSGELREGAELLAFRAGPRPETSAVKVLTPVGAANGLLSAAPDPGAGAPQYVDPMLRTQEAADASTQAREAMARRRTRIARITVPGRPDLRAGSTVQARGRDYRVLHARHVLDAEAGYVCDLLLEGDR